MKASRVLLLLMMGFVVLLMLSYPALQHTKRTRVAYKNFFSARMEHESAPNDLNEEALRRASMVLKKAKQRDRRDIIFFELIMTATVGLLLFLFVRAGRTISNSEPAHVIQE